MYNFGCVGGMGAWVYVFRWVGGVGAWVWVVWVWVVWVYGCYGYYGCMGSVWGVVVGVWMVWVYGFCGVGVLVVRVLYVCGSMVCVSVWVRGCMYVCGYCG